MDFSGFNWAEVIVAALSAFALGGLWYGPLFGSRWQVLVGLSDEQLAEANAGLIFGSAFVLNCFLAMMLSLFIEVFMAMGSGVMLGAAFGAFMGAAFVVPTFAINYLFARRRMRLYLIDVGYMVLQMALMGAILGGWS
jgi:hypothetical protein